MLSKELQLAFGQLELFCFVKFGGEPSLGYAAKGHRLSAKHLPHQRRWGITSEAKTRLNRKMPFPDMPC